MVVNELPDEHTEAVLVGVRPVLQHLRGLLFGRGIFAALYRLKGLPGSLPRLDEIDQRIAAERELAGAPGVPISDTPRLRG